MAKTKFEISDTDDYKKDCFEFDYADELDNFEINFEDLHFAANDFENPFESLAEQEKVFNNSIKFLEKKIEPFFVKHSANYGNKIFELYDNLAQIPYNYYNEFIKSELPDIKTNFIKNLQEDNADIEAGKKYKQIIFAAVQEQQELRQAAFARTCGENEREILNCIDEMVEDKILIRSKKGNAYCLTIASGINADAVMTVLDNKIKNNLALIQKVKDLNPPIKKYVKLNISLPAEPAKEKVTEQPPADKEKAIKAVIITAVAFIAGWLFVGFLTGLIFAFIAFIISPKILKK